MGFSIIRLADDCKDLWGYDLMEYNVEKDVNTEDGTSYRIKENFHLFSVCIVYDKCEDVADEESKTNGSPTFYLILIRVNESIKQELDRAEHYQHEEQHHEG